MAASNVTDDVLTTDSTNTTAYYLNAKYEMGEYWAAIFLEKYYRYVVAGIGLPGNIATLVVLSQMKPITSASVYMAALATSDFFALSFGILFQYLEKSGLLSDVVCKLIYFLEATTLMFSNWTLVVMTFERMVAVNFPFRVKQYCTRRNAIIATVVCLVIFCGVNAIWFQGIEKNPTEMRCSYSAELRIFLHYQWRGIIEGCLSAVAPCIILFLLNILIVYGLQRSQAIKNELTKNSGKMRDEIRKQRQLTVMLLTVSVVFVLLIAPNAIYFFVRPHWDYMKTAYQYSVRYLLVTLVEVLIGLNHAINFYLYALMGQRFRKKLWQIITCSCKKTSSDHSVYMTSTTGDLSKRNQRSTRISTVS